AVSFFFSSRRRHTRSKRDWSSDVCSSDLNAVMEPRPQSVLTARKSTRLTPSLSTYCSSPSASISEGGLMRKIHGLPRLVIDAARSEERRVGKESGCGMAKVEEQKSEKELG